MPACPYCSSTDLTRDGHNQRGRAVCACRACGGHATSESTSLVAAHRFPRDVILLAVRYHLQLGAAAERIAGILADRGVDVSGRKILRWVQKFGPALSDEIRRHRRPISTTWLVDETYVKILGELHYLYRGVDEDGQVLDCWLSRTRDLAAAEAFFRRTTTSSGCMPEHVVTDKATFYPSAIRTHAPGAKHTATGFYNLVISTNRCERNHGYVKSHLGSYSQAMPIFDLLRERRSMKQEMDSREFLYQMAVKLGLTSHSPRMDALAEEFFAGLIPAEARG